MAKKKFDRKEISYLDIKEIAFSYLVPEDAAIPEMAEPTQYSMQMTKMVSTELKVVRLVFTIELRNMLEYKKDVTGLFTTEHLFIINNFSELIDRSEGLYIDEELDETLTDLVYSTTRGLLHQKLRGTLLAGFLLPIIRPAPERSEQR